MLGCAANTTPSIRTDSSTPIKSSSDSQKKKEIDDLYRTILKRTEGIPWKFLFSSCLCSLDSLDLQK